MKGLVLLGPCELVPKDIDEPSPAAHEVVINVEITGMGGSESAAFQNPGIRPLPNIMGHSICGVTGRWWSFRRLYPGNRPVSSGLPSTPKVTSTR